MARTAEQIKAELQRLAAELTPLEADVAARYERRASLYVEARALAVGRPTARQLAEWARSSEGAVNQVLRKAQRAAEGQPRRTYGKAVPAAT